MKPTTTKTKAIDWFVMFPKEKFCRTRVVPPSVVRVMIANVDHKKVKLAAMVPPMTNNTVGDQDMSQPNNPGRNNKT